MVRLEGLDSRIAELSKRRDELAIEVDAITRDRDQALEQISQVISATRSDRDALVKDIEAELLSLYEKIRSTSDGLAAVPLSDGKCQGCHLTMSAAELTRMNALANGVGVRGVACRRILIRIT